MNAALGGAGKVVLKGGKLAAPVIKKAWEAALAKSPILKFTVGRVGTKGEKVINDLSKSKQQPWTIRKGQEWKSKIKGKGQVTGGKANPDKAHAFKSTKEAVKAAKRGDVTKVQMDLGVNRMLPKSARLGPKGNRRPDVTYQTKDGKIHQVDGKK